MAVNMTSADSALKALYLGVVSDQLNTRTNPLFNKIKSSVRDVWGKEVRKLAPYGVNGGIGAGSEDGDLPQSKGNGYAQFVQPLKNLYGRLEISDKAMRASANSAGAFVDLLNAEMDGLLKAAKFNLGRMLFGDGSGKLATISAVLNNVLTVDTVQYLMEGMLVDVYSAAEEQLHTVCTVTAVDRTNKTVTLTGEVISAAAEGGFIVVQGSYNNELTGLGEIFKTDGTLYGIDRSASTWMQPYIKTNCGDISDIMLQTAIDTLEERSGGTVDYIVCSYGVKRAYQEYLASSRLNLNSMELEGGYKALSYNGIPLVADRFCPVGTMYLLDTSEFTMHQLCDWRWIEDADGRVLRQVAGKPVYSATLVKYADLMCDKPCAQGMLTGITEA